MFNWIVSDAKQNLELFDCVQTNDLYRIELFVLHSNNENPLTVENIAIFVCKRISCNWFKNEITNKPIFYVTCTYI